MKKKNDSRQPEFIKNFVSTRWLEIACIIQSLEQQNFKAISSLLLLSAHTFVVRLESILNYLPRNEVGKTTKQVRIGQI